MSTVRAQDKIRPGSYVRARRLTSISGDQIEIPDLRRVVHLQFRRFAGCPVCDLHLRSFTRRHREIEAANIREAVIFHSTAEDLETHAREFPFALVADPEKCLYKEFGVESSRRALFDPRVWRFIVAGISRSLFEIVTKGHPLPPVTPRGGRFGLPADFLIAAGGRVLACKYGAHAYDQWSVDEVIALAHAHVHMLQGSK